MLDRIKLLNPFRAIGAEEAGEAARLGAWGAFLASASCVVGGVMVYVEQDEIIADVEARLAQQGADARALEMVNFGAVAFPIGLAIAMAAAYLVFGLVQWRRLTSSIPLIMFLISAYSVVLSLLGFFTPLAREALTLSAATQAALGWAVELLSLALFWAGFRGGSRLRKRAVEAA